MNDFHPAIQALLEKHQNAIRTDAMSYEEWLVKRRKSIGGSDVGGIMQLSTYNSPLTVALQKYGRDKSREMSPAAKRGKLLEPVVRGWFSEAHPDLLITSMPYMFYSREYPFMSANVDGLIMAESPIITQEKEISGLSGLGGLEIKSSKYGYNFGEDEIPDDYYAQIQHYMAVLDLPWFVLSVCFLDNEEIKNYSVMRNDAFITRMVSEEKQFWDNYIVPGILPPPVGIEAEDEMITGQFDGCSGTLNLTDEELALCRKINDLKEQIKPLEKQEEIAKIELKTKLLERANPSDTEKKLYAIGGAFTVSWTSFETHRVDSKALKEAGLYDQFSKVSTSTRLTVSLKKGA
jgi:putative phage-type endonuclease